MIGGLSLATAGIVLLGLGTSAATATLGLVLIGVGLSLPYPLFYDQGERLLPDRPLGGLGLLQVGGNAFPILVVPLFGAALASGDSDLAFLALAAFTVFTALLNARAACRLNRPWPLIRPALALADPLLADPGEVHRRLDHLLLRHLAMQVPPVSE